MTVFETKNVTVIRKSEKKLIIRNQIASGFDATLSILF